MLGTPNGATGRRAWPARHNKHGAIARLNRRPQRRCRGRTPTHDGATPQRRCAASIGAGGQGRGGTEAASAHASRAGKGATAAVGDTRRRPRPPRGAPAPGGATTAVSRFAPAIACAHAQCGPARGAPSSARGIRRRIVLARSPSWPLARNPRSDQGRDRLPLEPWACSQRAQSATPCALVGRPRDYRYTVEAFRH